MSPYIIPFHNVSIQYAIISDVIIRHNIQFCAMCLLLFKISWVIIKTLKKQNNVFPLLKTDLTVYVSTGDI